VTDPTWHAMRTWLESAARGEPLSRRLATRLGVDIADAYNARAVELRYRGAAIPYPTACERSFRGVTIIKTAAGRAAPVSTAAPGRSSRAATCRRRIIETLLDTPAGMLTLKAWKRIQAVIDSETQHEVKQAR